ncbi:MAG: signal peptidase II, partial [Glaciecola sp.]
MLDLIKTTGLRFLWISTIIFVFDQWTKNAIVGNMRLFESIQLTGFFNLTYVH